MQELTPRRGTHWELLFVLHFVASLLPSVYALHCLPDSLIKRRFTIMQAMRNCTIAKLLCQSHKVKSKNGRLLGLGKQQRCFHYFLEQKPVAKYVIIDHIKSFQHAMFDSSYPWLLEEDNTPTDDVDGDACFAFAYNALP